MDIDVSMVRAFQKCPLYFYERYVRNIEKDWEVVPGADSLAFGIRVHEILENYYRSFLGSHPKAEVESNLEDEAQEMFSAYRQFYPTEGFQVIDVETTHRVELPVRVFCPLCNGTDLLLEGPILRGDTAFCKSCRRAFAYTRHSLLLKMDLVMRENKTGLLQIMDHKTERRNTKSNLPQAWAANLQASVYLWAAERIYGEPVKNLILNVLTRRSEKGRIGPSFRRDEGIVRTPEQKEAAIENVLYVAEKIEELKARFGDSRWPTFNSDRCVEGNLECDFYKIHILGLAPEEARIYKEAAPYLDL